MLFARLPIARFAPLCQSAPVRPSQGPAPVPKPRFSDHVILICGAVVMTGPMLILLWRLVVGLNPAEIWAVFADLWVNGVSRSSIGASAMMWNSMVLALGIAILKCALSMLAAYALVCFRLRGANILFGAILLAMFFPIEARILPTFAVTTELGLQNTYAGMILPITASGLGVLVLRRFLLQLPPELMEAAQMDGAGPLRFLRDVVIPMSLPAMTALFVILFALGWNQYVWPIMVTTTSQSHDTLVRGMAYAGLGGRSGLALAFLALLPPTVLVIVLQRPLVRAMTAGIH